MSVLIIYTFVFCSVLQQQELDLELEKSAGQKKLAAFKLKHEAYQFTLYQKANQSYWEMDC